MRPIVFLTAWLMLLSSPALAHATTRPPSIAAAARADAGGIATVRVEVNLGAARLDRAQALRGWLVQRLLGEGYAVAGSTGGAHGEVIVYPWDDGLVVEVADATGERRRQFEIEDGPAALIRAEVLHRALSGVEQVCDVTQPLSAPGPGVAMRWLGTTADAELHSALTQALATAGMTLHAQPLPADTLLCIEPQGSRAEVGIGPGATACAEPWLVLDLADRSSQSLQRAGDSLVTALARGREPATALDLSAVPDLAPPRPAERREPVEPPPPQAELRMRGEGGVAIRGRRVDPLVAAGWRLGRTLGAGGRLSVSLIPSSGRGMGVLDMRLVVGPEWSLSSGGRVHGHVGLLVGTDMHMFAVGSGDRRPGDVALAAELPASIGFTLVRQARLELGLNPGITTKTWRHYAGLRREGQVIWERPAWRIGITVGLSHGWRIQ